MFGRKTNDKHTLQEQIDTVLEKIAENEPGTAVYKTLLEQLDMLYKMKNLDRSHRVKPDTLVAAGTNLAGIGLILGFERAHIVTSKALSMIVKPRT